MKNKLGLALGMIMTLMFLAAYGDTRTWNGSVSTDWDTDDNWTPGSVPTATDDVVINGGYTFAPTLDLSGGAVTISSLSLGSSAASALTVSYGNMDDKRVIVPQSVLIGANGKLMHAQNSSEQTHRLFLDVGVDLEIVSGGSIDLNARGFYQSGPGGGSQTSAGYGGQGGSDARNNQGATYGSITEPSDLGSSGHNLYAGGAVRLSVGETLTVDGALSANGSTYATGGSIWIAANTIAGAGSITANGSYGGGGRIALYYATNTHAGTLTANANIQGAAGTIYLKPELQLYGDLIADSHHDIKVYTYLFNSSDPSATLHFATITAKRKARIFVGGNIAADAYLTEGDGIIRRWFDADILGMNPTVRWTGAVDTNWYTPGNWSTGVVPDEDDTVVIEGSVYDLGNLPTVQIPIDTNVTVRALGIGNGAVLTINAPFDEVNNRRLIVTDDVCLVPLGVLTHGDHEAQSQTEINRLNLEVGGDMALHYLSRIGLMGKGFRQAGPGYAHNWPAHGGRGQHNSKVYGDIKQPIDLGSARYAHAGGGGALKLHVAGTLNNNGWIQGSGRPPYSSGGSLWIRVQTLTGESSGRIEANGSYGGGGRIAIYYDANTFSGTISAYGSVGGMAGTIYEKQTAQVNGTLTIDNNNIIENDSDTFTSLNDVATVAYTFDAIVVTNRGWLVVGGDDSLELAANGTFHNADGTARLTVDAGGVFTNAGVFTLAGTGTALTVDAAGEFVNQFGSVFRYIGTPAGIDPVTVHYAFDYQSLDVTGPGQTFLWSAGETYTVHATFTVMGAKDDLVTLHSTADATPWYLKLTGQPGKAQYIRVKDSDARLGRAVAVAPHDGWRDSIDEGNNFNWIFARGTIFLCR